MRPAQIEDLDTIMELEHSTFKADAFSRRQYRHLICSSTCKILLHEEGNQLQGMVVATWRTGSSILRIHSIAVAPHMRRRGIASLLLREAIELARQLDRQWVVLEVDERNSGAIRLYQRFGFRKIETLANYYGENQDGLQMALQIEQRKP